MDKIERLQAELVGARRMIAFLKREAGLEHADDNELLFCMYYREAFDRWKETSGYFVTGTGRPETIA